MAFQYDLKWVRPGDLVLRELREFRHRVLYAPYGVDMPEWDDDDPASMHVVALSRGQLAGYGRLVTRGREAQIRHLCMAAQFRGVGLGAELLDELIGRAREQGAGLVFLNARFTALGLYRSRGFKDVGEMFHTENTHLPHKRMERML